MRGEGEGRHGFEGRGSFNRASRAELMKSGSADVSVHQKAQIMFATDETRQAVINHHEKNAKAWETKRYGEMLKKGTQRPVLTPGWSRDDPTAGYRAKAAMEVRAKKEQRLARVDQAQKNMMVTGRLRTTRRIGRDRGLGE